MKRDYQDIITGALVLAAGGFIAAYAASNYDLGTLRRMGAGAFPFGVGVVLFVLGLLIGIPAFFRGGTFQTISVRPAVAVLGGIVVFALLVRPFGLIPAVCGLILAASIAEKTFRPVAIAGVCATMAVLIFLIFRLALNLPLAMFRWPF
jgi:hypothetical protein